MLKYRTVNLINPPQPNSLDDQIAPPLGLMYIAAVLEDKGIDVNIIDLALFKRKDWVNAIGQADLFGITVYSTSFNITREIASIIKNTNPHAPVILGGHHPTALATKVLKTDSNFDAVVRNEGEGAMLEIALGKPFLDIRGLTHRVSEGIIINEDRPFIKKLDLLPLPARHLIRIYDYTRRVHGQRATPLITSRGCPYICSFCCKETLGHGTRFRSVDSVIGEMKHIVDTYDIRAFMIEDDIFTLNRPRFRQLCDELREMEITFRCNGNARIDTFSEFTMLYDAGCREINFGIESGSQKVLSHINKMTTVERNKKAIKDAKRAGIITKAYLMVGCPGESKETIEETKQFLIDADPDQCTLFSFIPLPGCDIWKRPSTYGIRIRDYDFSNYFTIAGQNEGGIVTETESLTVKQMKEARLDLVEFLSKRKQRGYLPTYSCQ